MMWGVAYTDCRRCGCNTCICTDSERRNSTDYRLTNTHRDAEEARVEMGENMRQIEERNRKNNGKPIKRRFLPY
jgi:hypothetical protein